MPTTEPPSQVIELRRYLMRPGRRDDLVALFEREFIETQATVGMPVLGIFREPDQPDRFTWLRGFADMPGRAAALAAFYGGPVWQAHREAANATMLDSDDVLLLRPSAGLPALAPPTRPPGRRWRALVLPLRQPADPAVRDAVAAWLPAWRLAGAAVQAVLETEPAENNFPRLPVRTDGPKLVLLLALPQPQPRPQPDPPMPAALAQALAGLPEVLHLDPTVRSPRA